MSKMSLVDCWCCPCFRPKPKLAEDEPLLIVEFTKLSSADKVHCKDGVCAFEGPKTNKIKFLRQSSSSDSDGDKMHATNEIYTDKRRGSNYSEDTVETVSEKIPLWQQIERIKSPTDDRPPLWN